jgi:fructose-1,6-bisphosphatase I
MRVVDGASQKALMSQRGSSSRIESSKGRRCLEDFLLEQSQRAEFTEVEGRENLQELISAVAAACKEISLEIDAEPLRLADLARDGAKKPLGDSAAVASVNATGDVQNELDVRANDIFLKALQECPSCALAASEEETDTIELNTALDDGVRDKYAVTFDPIDGSKNIECSIPTGTIFGVYKHDPSKGVMQSGANLVAAGYTLYSSSTILVLTLGQGTGTHGFTMDRNTGRFILTHPDMKIPSSGQIYSLNDARYFEWPQGLREYIDSVRRGEGATGKQYSARYIGSLVGDFHRTMMYGGVFGYPGDSNNKKGKLRLLYECAPISFLAEQAGGRGSTGNGRVLDVVPDQVHMKCPLFIGSQQDVATIERFLEKGQLQTNLARNKMERMYKIRERMYRAPLEDL